jgi:hypothetical protein
MLSRSDGSGPTVDEAHFLYSYFVEYFFIIFNFYYFIIHMYKQCLGHQHPA